MAKVLAMLAQPKEAPPPLENVEKKRLEIPYITKEKKVERRPVRLIMPKGATCPMPLIFVPHYEMGEDAMELRAYLQKGWAVASAVEFDNKYNAQLTDDDLVFNNAALYTLRNLPEIDRKRIAVVGGSAGGYMSLMLNALQLGICCSIANCPITNVYFNFYRYFVEANQLNQKAIEEMSKANGQVEDKKDRQPLDVMKSVMGLPLPFLAGLSRLFLPILQNFPNSNDMTRWEAFSPVALAETFCNPIVISHFTSDVLVPVDQVSKRFTYAEPGDSLPVNFSSRLPEDIIGKLGCSLEERLPEGETRIECIPALEANEDGILPYAADKRFNLNIYDEGPVEGYGSHRIQPGTGRIDDTPYLEEMLSITAAKTNVLTVEKLRLLLERYQGKSVQLPTHEGVDDEVYGSLNIYRKEVFEELSEWKKDNGADAWRAVGKELLNTQVDATYQEELQNLMEQF
ncbi:Acetyl xylan esterase (AXE1) [Paenibacillus sp. CF095]|uniref:alpha/beta hydrolase family protein n=1 Tax=Paenibacillus sp. CF095 TaxID=1881033 RepID=UPI000881BE90|nr:acetylxylan esterase [Paenibacillus sp. CF095]SDD54027.1 Acetyl xylan esterase (AXE1) [Paenibacillus sp. CF095]